MVESSRLKLRNGYVHAVRIPLPNAPLIIIKSSNGYVMCGYLNMDVANKLSDIAALVTRVKTIDDALDAKVVEFSSEARIYDIKPEMTGRQFLNLIMKK